ncbi:MAG: calcium-translocating P-type ATPase, SERCA-type [Nanoarchaeota archaeon]
MSVNNWHEMGTEKVLKIIESSMSGLSEKEVQRRLTEYGENLIKEEKKTNKLKIFINQFTSLLVIILITAAIVSALLLNSPIDAAVIMIIVILNGIFGFIQEYRAEKAIEALKKLASPEAIVVRGGKRKTVKSKELVPGDIVLLYEGTKIPADMRILEVTTLKLDESSLTGESVPVNKDTTPVKNAQIADRENMAYMGTMVTYGRGMGVVTETGMKTEMGKIARMIEDVKEEETPLQKRLGVFGKNLGFMIMGICALVVIIMLLKSGVLLGTGNMQSAIIDSVILGIALAVAAIPEGLPAVVTITLALSLQRLSKKNAIIRKLSTVETLGSTTIICSDKTGTLTRNEMTVRKIFINGKIIDVTGKGYVPEGNFLYEGEKIDPLKDSDLSLLLTTGVLCNNASLSQNNSIVGDPTEGALLIAAAKILNLNKIKKEYEFKEEFPFSSERKRMSVIYRNNNGMQSFVKGAPEIILDRCTHILKNGQSVAISKEDKKKILYINRNLSKDALRVLGIAFKKVKKIEEKEAENGLTFIGMIGMMDPPRKHVREDIATCKKAGIKIVMITGDHRDTAIAIAKEINMFEEGQKSLTGAELDKMSEKEFSRIVENITVYARVNPEHKMKIVTALQKKGHIVAMTGDGVNDAPALKKADIGVSMGINGTDVAKEASDMILSDDNFTSIVSAVKMGRATYDNIKKFIQYLLSSNLGEVLVILLALLIGFSDPVTGAILIPVTAIQLLWINLLTDGLPALALGVDPPSNNIMERSPRNPKENILNRDMLSDIIFVGIIIAIGTLFVFSIMLSKGAIIATTSAFTTLVIFEMVRVQTVRIKFGMSIFSNNKLILAMSASIMLQLAVVYIPFLQTFFKTAPLGLNEWALILGVSFIVLILVEIKRRVWDNRRGLQK